MLIHWGHITQQHDSVLIGDQLPRHQNVSVRLQVAVESPGWDEKVNHICWQLWPCRDDVYEPVFQLPIFPYKLFSLKVIYRSQVLLWPLHSLLPRDVHKSSKMQDMNELIFRLNVSASQHHIFSPFFVMQEVSNSQTHIIQLRLCASCRFSVCSSVVELWPCCLSDFPVSVAAMVLCHLWWASSELNSQAAAVFLLWRDSVLGGHHSLLDATEVQTFWSCSSSVFLSTSSLMYQISECQWVPSHLGAFESVIQLILQGVTLHMPFSQIKVVHYHKENLSCGNFAVRDVVTAPQGHCLTLFIWFWMLWCGRGVETSIHVYMWHEMIDKQFLSADEQIVAGSVAAHVVVTDFEFELYKRTRNRQMSSKTTNVKRQVWSYLYIIYN